MTWKLLFILRGITEEDIIKKLNFGFKYYKKNCSKDQLYRTYKDIINEYKKRYHYGKFDNLKYSN